MGLDIRWPMGLLFLLLGAILAVYGVVLLSKDHPDAVAEREKAAAKAAAAPDSDASALSQP